VAVVLYIVYFFMKDSQKSRKLVPWALGIAAVVNFLIVVWVIVYISFIYKRDKVYVTSGKKVNEVGDDDDSDWHNDEDSPGRKRMKYVKVNKINYIIEHVAEPLIYGITYTIAFCWTKKWVKNHENQKRAYG
jgi:amino acid transporter